MSPTVTVHGLVTGFPTGAATLAADVLVAAVTAAYAAVALRAPRWPGWRAVAFVAGGVLVFVAVGSSVATYARQDFSVHIVDYLVLADVAPALIALGAPVTLALRRAPAAARSRMALVLGSRPAQALTHPVAAALLSYIALMMYFLTPLYSLSERSSAVLAAADAVFLVTGCLYWGTVVGVDPPLARLSHPLRLLLLASGIPVVSLVGLGLATTHRSIDVAVHTVADTHRGGAILWGGGVLVLLVAISVMFWLWSGYDRRVALLDDLRRDEELARRADALAGGTFGRRRPKPPSAA